MREILFKGFHECENGNTVITINGVKKHGKWVEGDLIHRKIWSNSFVVIREFDDGFDHYNEYEVISETISQYIGLNDKNKKNIFENDILNIDTYSYEEPEDSMCGQVDIGVLGNAITWEENETVIYNYLNDIQGSYTTIYEIVGNIFENPELLNND